MRKYAVPLLAAMLLTATPSRAGLWSMMALMEASDAAHKAEEASRSSADTNAKIVALQKEVESLTAVVHALVRAQETPAERAKEDRAAADAKTKEEFERSPAGILAAKKAREAGEIEAAKKRKGGVHGH